MLLNYLFPLAFFVLAGTLMANISPTFRDTMIPAMSLFASMSCFLLGMPSALVSARDAGVLRSFRINGVPGWTALTMPVLANFVHVAVATLLIALIGTTVMTATAPSDAARFVLGWVLGVAATAGFGAVIATVASNSRGTVLLAQLVFIPSMILGGLMTPPDALPPALSRISLLLPAAHAMRVFSGTPGWRLSALSLAAGSVVAFAVAALLYEWDTKNQRPAWTKLAAILAFAPYVAAAIAVGP